MTSILRPKALRPGDLVAVVAPSSGLEKDEAPLLERGVDVLEQMGFVVRVSSLVDLERSWWWAAAPPAEVADDLNRHLRDPDVRAHLLAHRRPDDPELSGSDRRRGRPDRIPNRCSG